MQTERVNKLALSSAKELEIGAIAGNKNDFLLGQLLNQKNDGRIRVASVRYDGLKDFLILPYGHKEIHHQIQTAKFVISFLQQGEFHNSHHSPKKDNKR